jgi:hypothetical protein
MKHIELIIATLSLLFSSSHNFGQIDLGTAVNFVMFTSAGAFDNVGESQFVGDIGTNVGAITGFPPGTVTGDIHQANPTSLQAAVDVEDAYNYLTGVPCDSTISSALGDNQILTPYTYCVLTAAALSGELILDAENDPDALYVIKITGLLDFIGLSEISLINLASENNVYWQIDGAVNVGDSAVFRGNILANGALSFADGSNLEGRALSRVGAVSTINMNASLPINDALSIDLIKLEGKNMLSHNFISWSTASETNNNYFTLERTTDGVDYTKLTNINGAGTSSKTNDYNFSDFHIEGEINYYRLSQTDYDGISETFDLISIDNSKSYNSIIKIFNMMGQEVNKDYIGLRIIYFSNGDTLKICGKYVAGE